MGCKKLDCNTQGTLSNIHITFHEVVLCPYPSDNKVNFKSLFKVYVNLKSTFGIIGMPTKTLFRNFSILKNKLRSSLNPYATTDLKPSPRLKLDLK